MEFGRLLDRTTMHIKPTYLSIRRLFVFPPGLIGPAVWIAVIVPGVVYRNSSIDGLLSKSKFVDVAFCKLRFREFRKKLC